MATWLVCTTPATDRGIILTNQTLRRCRPGRHARFGRWQDDALGRTHARQSRARRTRRHAWDWRYYLPILVSRYWRTALAIGWNGRSTKTYREEWLHHHRRDARQDDIHDVCVAAAATY